MFEIFKKQTSKIEKKNFFWNVWIAWLISSPTLNAKCYYDLYKWNSDLKRGVDEICENTLSWGRKLVQWINNRENYKTIYNNEKLNTFFSNIEDVKNSMIQQMLINWSAFVQLVYNLSEDLIWLEVLDPRFLTINRDWITRNITWFLYQAKFIWLNQIYIFKNINDFDNPWCWISSIQWIVYDLLADKESNIYNYTFFKNDALPSALYQLEDWLAEEEQEALMEQIKATLNGGHNKNKSLVSSNIVDIKTIKNNHTDMDFINQRKFTIEKICSALWIPKIILWYSEGVNYSNAEVFYKKFIENTIKPLEEKLERFFTNIIKNEFNTDLEFDIIDNHVDSISNMTDIVIKNLNNWVITRNEARDMLWLATIQDNEAMDEFTVWSNTISLDDVILNEQSLNETLPTENIQNNPA